MPIASWSATKGSASTSTARPTTGRLVAWGPGNEPDNPKSDQLAKSRKQQADEVAKKTVATPPKQGSSLFSKVKSGAKEFASSATQGEQKFAQGVARVLPGGADDLKAEAKSSQADQQNLKRYSDLHKAGKLSDKQYQKATQTTAKQANATSKDVQTTEKAMPTKAQIGLGAASTAADIITAGELPAIKVAVLGKKAALAANVGTKLASNAAAGGLNAAAGGGSKGDVIKNAAAGAVLPEVLHHGGQAVSKGVTMAADKLGVGGKTAAKELVTNTQTKSLLDRVRQSQGVEPEPTLPQPGEVIAPTPQSELHPDTAKALQDTMATVHQPKAVLVADAAKQAATEAAGKQSEQAAKDAEKATADTKKIDQQLEVYDAKAKDAKDGKLSNVDQVKVKQLKEQKAEIAKTVPESEIRPSDALQTQIEQAHNAGDSAKEAELVKQLPDQGMNPNATITAERRAELMTKMRGDVSPVSEQKTVKPKSESEFKSRVYERLKEQYPDELKDDVGYDAINLKDQAEKATKLLTEDKQKAYRVATGQEVSSDLTATSANIALSQKALDEGNTKLYESLVRNRSLAQTRRGQELVSEKASVSDNSTDRYVKQLLADRLNQLGTKHTFGISLKKTSAKETAVGVIDKEVKKLDTQIRNKKLDTKTALALLDKMECL